jgi:hypothetical protein
MPVITMHVIAAGATRARPLPPMLFPAASDPVRVSEPYCLDPFQRHTLTAQPLGADFP